MATVISKTLDWSKTWIYVHKSQTNKQARTIHMALKIDEIVPEHFNFTEIGTNQASTYEHEKI